MVLFSGMAMDWCLKFQSTTHLQLAMPKIRACKVLTLSISALLPSAANGVRPRCRSVKSNGNTSLQCSQPCLPFSAAVVKMTLSRSKKKSYAFGIGSPHSNNLSPLSFLDTLCARLILAWETRKSTLANASSAFLVIPTTRQLTNLSSSWTMFSRQTTFARTEVSIRKMVS